MIHYEDKPLIFHRLLSVRMDCKFCTEFELIIKKKSEIESVLQKMIESWKMKFSPKNYIVFGTIDMNDWKQNVKTPLLSKETLDKTSAFIDIVDFTIRPAGWYFDEK